MIKERLVRFKGKEFPLDRETIKQIIQLKKNGGGEQFNGMEVDFFECPPLEERLNGVKYEYVEEEGDGWR